MKIVTNFKKRHLSCSQKQTKHKYKGSKEGARGVAVMRFGGRNGAVLLVVCWREWVHGSSGERERVVLLGRWVFMHAVEPVLLVIEAIEAMVVTARCPCRPCWRQHGGQQVSAARVVFAFKATVRAIAVVGGGALRALQALQKLSWKCE